MRENREQGGIMKIVEVLAYPFCFVFLWVVFVLFSFVRFCYEATVGSILDSIQVLKGESVSWKVI